MNTEKKLALLQYTYAAALAEAVNVYARVNVLNDIVASRKTRQVQAAPQLNSQLGVKTVEEVFARLSEIYGCANWSVEITNDGYTAMATSCKLCALSKRMGGANPCNGWCLDPMFAMIAAVSGIDSIDMVVESTLMDNDCCRVHIPTPPQER